MLTYLNYFLASIIAYLGLLLGVILIKFAPEEQKPGKQYFILLKKILFILILASFLFFYKINFILSIMILIIVLIISKKTNLSKSHLIYFILGIIFYFSYFSKIFDLFIIESILMFLYGIPTASLILKKKNYFDIFVRNLWFFLPIILFYLVT